MSTTPFKTQEEAVYSFMNSIVNSDLVARERLQTTVRVRDNYLKRRKKYNKIALGVGTIAFAITLLLFLLIYGYIGGLQVSLCVLVSIIPGLFLASIVSSLPQRYIPIEDSIDHFCEPYTRSGYNLIDRYKERLINTDEVELFRQYVNKVHENGGTIQTVEIMAFQSLVLNHFIDVGYIIRRKEFSILDVYIIDPTIAKKDDGND